MLRLLNASEKPTKRRLLQADKVLCDSVLQMTMSTQSFRSCLQCGANVHVARKRCVCGCNLKKGRGRPKKALRDLRGMVLVRVGGDLWVPQQRRGMVLVTSGGRPVGTTAEKGYGVSTSGGRPVGTTAEKGYGVSTSGGRPVCTTAEKGYGVSTSGGRPVGTAAEKGYGVSTSGGRPVGTTAEKGYGTGGGRLPDYKVGKHIEFRGIDLPDKWDTSKDKINLTPDILERCTQRVMQHKMF